MTKRGLSRGAAVRALLASALVAVSYRRTVALAGALLFPEADPYDLPFLPGLGSGRSDPGPAGVGGRADPYDYPFAFSACLLYMDDAMVLPEWLAYHYHFLPLRHLIVAVDPHGETTPDAVLEPWRRGMGMTIEVWGEEDYCDDECLPGGPVRRDRMSSHRRLIARQVHFYRRCLERLGEANRTWTAVMDVDEYLAFNRIRLGEERGRKRVADGPRRRLPAPGNHSATAADFIRSEAGHFSRSPCHYYPRIFFGPQDSPVDADADGDGDGDAVPAPRPAPAGFNETLFQTYRYRIHEPWDQPMGMGKSIVDAGGYEGTDEVSAHRVLRGLCVGAGRGVSDDAPFRVQHYIGSAEAYLSRPGDHRRSEETYLEKEKAFDPRGPNDDLRGWFSAFAEKVGEDRAMELTQHAIVRALREAGERKRGRNASAFS